MNTQDLRKRYLEYFKEKAHIEIASSSLLPKNDPTTLFTGSGMQQLMPYLLGEKHPKGTKLVDSQKCFRADDIEEVGDNRHTTFFEMLGNWSLGDYFKEEQLKWFFSFLVDELEIDPEKLYVTAFLGDEKTGIKKDEDSSRIWKKLFLEKGIEAKDIEIGSEENGYKVGMKDGRIFYYDSKKNWWSRSGVPENMPTGEPGGPDSEVFYEFTEIKHNKKYGEHCHPNCDCGRFLEIGNSVFMEYVKNEDGSFSNLPQKNVDFGGGLERIAAAVNKNPDVFMIDVFKVIIEDIEKFTGITYKDADEKVKKSYRILCDHIRAATFLMADGVRPSNLGQGYVLRRLIRRAVRYAKLANIFKQGICAKISEFIVNDYKEQYENLEQNKASIFSEFDLEESKFEKVIENGTKRILELIERGSKISGQEAFDLFTTHGFPYELTKEMADEAKVEIDEDGFRKEFEKHQEVSRADVHEKKFEGGLADKENPKIIKYHTAAHLMLAALREVLGDHVHQKGSNITEERIRFDFSHPEKMTDEEKHKVEEWVNDKISKKLEVFMTETNIDGAKKYNAEGEFADKYGDKIKVYSIGGEIDSEMAVSKEICGGPHVKNTSELGVFRIKKEESSSSGVRRIKAILE
ncbi:alanine--tRNA ligase [bacterium]|nr:alanine--tRNA ligase [bacterium]